ncbi:MAG: hypothetical protein WBP11_10575 [Dokdonella sp.]
MNVTTVSVNSANPGLQGNDRNRQGCINHPVLLDRERKLHVHSLRMLRDVKINGGGSLGENVVLVIEAGNGIGWTVRGPVLPTREETGPGSATATTQ